MTLPRVIMELIVLAIIFMLALIIGHGDASGYTFYNVKVINCHDANRCMVNMTDGTGITHRATTVRLCDVTAPKHTGVGEPRDARLARSVLLKWLRAPGNLKVVVPSGIRDRFGQFYAYFLHNNKNINQRLIAEGYARKSKNSCKIFAGSDIPYGR